MPQEKYIKVKVGDQELDLGDASKLPLAISYALEDRENFQSKTPSRALNVIVPANSHNDRIANGYAKPGFEDTSPNQIFRGNRPCLIEAGGQELLVGKAFLFNGKHTKNPTEYEYNFYGNNGDWVVDLKDATLFDFFKDLTFTFSKANIISSWGYDGTDPNLPYVFAPVRYGEQMEQLTVPIGGTGIVTQIILTSGGTGFIATPAVTISGGGGTGATANAVVIGGSVVQVIITSGGSGYTSTPSVVIAGDGVGASAYAVTDLVTDIRQDYSMRADYMKPALSKYWLLYRGFKSLGYKIKSDFFDTPYFRRQVMPWTWGQFLYSDGTQLDNLDFLAKSANIQFVDFSYTGFWDLQVTNDSFNGAFDNNNVYSYVSTYNMRWDYLNTFLYGTLAATLHLNIFVDAVATANSNVEMRVQWYKNGVRVYSHDDNGNGTQLVKLNAPAVGRREFHGPAEDWFTINVDPGDYIEAKIYLHTFNSGSGIAHIHANVDAFELDYLRIPLGGTIQFANYTALQKFKFLDFVGGVIDEFNLCIGTDPVNKIVYFEPMHPYSLVDDQSVKTGGYITSNTLNWESKQDLSKESQMDQFSDYERELIFKYKDDQNDGGNKTIQDRNVNTLALAKYVFPDRFKVGNQTIENRFFSVVVHYDVTQWKGLGSDPTAKPQMICLIPENSSNTSRDEAQNTFQPKSAYYKGLITNVGWVFDGDVQTNFPYMFAVNYMAGGEDDPILSYCDEVIGPDGATVIGKGLMRRFFLQRLEIMRNGQFYRTFFYLNNKDVANFLHREQIVIAGQLWEVVEINNYQPLGEESTEVFLRKWSPVKNTA